MKCRAKFIYSSKIFYANYKQYNNSNVVISVHSFFLVSLILSSNIIYYNYRHHHPHNSYFSLFFTMFYNST